MSKGGIYIFALFCSALFNAVNTLYSHIDDFSPWLNRWVPRICGNVISQQTKEHFFHLLAVILDAASKQCHRVYKSVAGSTLLAPLRCIFSAEIRKSCYITIVIALWALWKTLEEEKTRVTLLITLTLRHCRGCCAWRAAHRALRVAAPPQKLIFPA